jgi:hypothetical protein
MKIMFTVQGAMAGANMTQAIAAAQTLEASGPTKSLRSQFGTNSNPHIARVLPKRLF